MANKKMVVQNIEINYKHKNDYDYICLTDIARFRTNEPDKVISNWMRTRNTIDYLGVWERLHNPDFKPLEFEGLQLGSGENSFLLSPKKWVETTNAVGIFSKSGNGGGTYAHKDIAFKFASWLSVEFELYMVMEFERLKQQEQTQIEWTAKRELAKLNYTIHTDAIKDNLIVPTLNPSQISFKYADEADLLNTALFGITAGEWRKENPDKLGNMRDYANMHQLLVLANLESYNAILIKDKIEQSERLLKLNEMAKQQLVSLIKAENKLYLPKA
ncbi:MAG: KilA-N domain-containing protein [Christensenellaceae bacterium]|jgi:hypothetical protein|nr:KilA-N domain-containing protein [Christensenellaceae bacterium]